MDSPKKSPEKKSALISGCLITAFPLQVLAAPDTVTPGLLQSFLILGFFTLPLIIAALIARYEPDLPLSAGNHVELSQPEEVTTAIGPEEADEFIRQPAIEVVVDAEPVVREPIRPPLPRKKQHAA